MTPSVVAFVGLGSNLGDSAGLLRDALRSLDGLPGTSVDACSGFYRTPAWGNTEQPDFINAVAMLRTALDPHVLLAAMLDIERLAGRERGDPADRWGPRTLDLDLLLYGDATIDAPGLRVPHPHLHERAFALVPLAEIAPDAPIPGHGRVRDALAAMAAGDVEALTYMSPPPPAAR
ncbi:2-amino-4-hydroxy-6-hydroxymethyldihydropteridine diphosphokinase [Novilysobacter arseniciresistens]|uniref:2-amino-4-hydroxy-6- hydroxymethyldihydropteridine diphosphokinase n=1 Tax=Novilysobacter arseniciresistens TaxID=1385522 RepID=UPI000689BFEC|nr:2-amino-4-hydroxy-6-hydroxymethyldihydropteridine diphosphokinase [Lysobacter arseniciresistens]